MNTLLLSVLILIVIYIYGAIALKMAYRRLL